MDEALTIRVRRDPGYAIVTVAGEIDIVTVARLREQLSGLAVGGRPLVVDLDLVSFIDAAGLGALAGAAGRAAAHGASLHVVCARSQIRLLFRLTGLDRPIPLARTLADALKALAEGRDTPASGSSGARRTGIPRLSLVPSRFQLHLPGRHHARRDQSPAVEQRLYLAAPADDHRGVADLYP